MALFLLTLLKIIGITLLAILMIVIVGVLLILFVPVRYNARVEGQVSELKELPLELKASWLLHIVRLYITGSGQGRALLIKILFFTVKRESLNLEIDRDENPAAELADQTEEAVEEALDTVNTYGNSNSAQATGHQASEHTEELGEQEEESQSIFARAKEIINKIRYFYGLSDRKEIISLTVLLIRRLLKAVKPKIFRVRGEVGFAKPETTGYFFAALGTVNAIARLDIKLSGNFEKAIANLSLEARGHLNLFSVLLPLGRYILSRPIWRIVKNIFFKKERV